MERIPEFIVNHLFLFSLLVAVLLLLLWNLFSDVLSGVKLIAPEEATRLINREDAQIIDLRAPTEFNQGHITDAFNIGADQLSERLRNLGRKDEKRCTILYCANGVVSTREARRLIRENFQKVYCLKGGVHSWRDANLPLVSSPNKKQGK